MARRKFSKEFKLEAVRLVREQGISVAQAARDLDLHENVLRLTEPPEPSPRTCVRDEILGVANLLSLNDAE